MLNYYLWVLSVYSLYVYLAGLLLALLIVLLLIRPRLIRERLSPTPERRGSRHNTQALPPLQLIPQRQQLWSLRRRQVTLRRHRLEEEIDRSR